MASPSDMKLRLSGGATNSDPLLSIGGAMSSTPVGLNLFDNVSTGEAATGDTEYRCVYLLNQSDDLLVNRLYFSLNTPSPDTVIELGLGTSGVDGTEDTVATTADAPVGVTFVEANGLDNALTIDLLPAGNKHAIWMKRVVTAGATPTPLDNFKLRWSAHVAGGAPGSEDEVVNMFFASHLGNTYFGGSFGGVGGGFGA